MASATNLDAMTTLDNSTMLSIYEGELVLDIVARFLCDDFSNAVWKSPR